MDQLGAMAFQSPGSPHIRQRLGHPPPSHQASTALSPSCSAEVYQEALREHAYELGIDLDNEPHFSWIAEESLVAPLPEGWVQIKQEDGEFAGSLYYYHEDSGASQWEHPEDEHYRDIYRREKEKLKPKAAPFSAWGEPNAAATGSPTASSAAWQHEEAQEQMAHLQKKLQLAYDEVESKSKAVQALRLDVTSKDDDLVRARWKLRSLNSMRAGVSSSILEVCAVTSPPHRAAGVTSTSFEIMSSSAKQLLRCAMIQQ